jgi:predicted DNA-binding ribbon-helix-helix protein
MTERANMPGLIKRSFSLAGHRTSIALEAPFWDVLNDVATARSMTLSALVASIDAARDPASPLTSTLRLLALEEARWSKPDGAQP